MVITKIYFGQAIGKIMTSASVNIAIVGANTSQVSLANIGLPN